MEKREETGRDVEKKEWETPSFQVIPFKNTKGGNESSIEETLGGTVATLS